MINPIALAVNLANYTAISGTMATSGSNTLSNLQSYNNNLYWQSTGSGTQKVVVDFGAATAISSIVVDGNNFGSIGATSIAVVGASTSDLSVGTTVISDIKSSGSLFLSQFPTQTYRYWGLWFIGGTVAPQMSNLFFGNTLQFTTTYNYGYKTENNEYITAEKVALDGTLVSAQSYAGRIIYEIQFGMQNSAWNTAYKTFLKTIRGKLNPFYFMDIDGTTLRYMKLDSDYSPVNVSSYGVYNTETLRLKTFNSNF